MPYIDEKYRPDYQQALELIFNDLNRESWANNVADAFQQILLDVYGDVDSTRYFKQNELGGVLVCMASEWQRRLNIELNTSVLQDFRENLRFLKDPLSLAFVNKIKELIPQDDETQRAGHLNYLLTITMIRAVEEDFVKQVEVPAFVYCLFEKIYEQVTGPYEDLAIQKGGEVFPPAWL